eukprot:CAMPEP_0196665490 /NCGR_PEP_ID=MMETSP1086-20130531/61310_1 /TAXON_ID=77921 /ORGANISM="Cyanoptyche  gloeocystis , Strain SAG4.97" /LENGTH=75 /DNA_ID=CAMNT_0042002279 /DNA_START=50 /DNA_END=277 /DNA_ORIENTATION=+
MHIPKASFTRARDRKVRVVPQNKATFGRVPGVNEVVLSSRKQLADLPLDAVAVNDRSESCGVVPEEDVATPGVDV